MAHSTVVINRRGPPLVQQLNSLVFPATKSLAAITDGLIGITDTWSMMIWAKQDNNPANVSSKGLFSILQRSPTTTVNQIVMEGDGDNDVNQDLRIRVYKSNGQFAQLKRWLNVQQEGTDTWVQYVLTWGGASGNTGTNPLELKLYTQGIDRGPYDGSGSTVDNDSTLVTDTARAVQVGIGGTIISGARWDGKIYSAAVYDSILSPSEVAASYNEGNAVTFDLEKNSGAYTSSGNLIHYYRLGQGTTELEFGTDHVASTSDQSMDHRTENSGVAFDSDDLNPDVPDGQQPPAVLQTSSLENFVADGELASVGVQDATLGITDTFSVACWSKLLADPQFGVDTMFAYRGDPLGGVNSLEMSTGFNNNAHLRVELTDASQAIRQSHQWNNAIDGGASAPWHHYVVTWDGTVSGLKVYIDGVDTAPDSSSTNLDGSTITDTNRDVYIGGRFTGSGDRWDGRIYSAAIYDSVLSADEVSYIYNGGNARDVDLESNFGAYLSAANLIHYYRFLGTTGAEFGTDRGTASTAVDLANTFLTDADLNVDIPL